MSHSFQKGKFYTLPVVDILREDVNSYFIVLANDRHYPIRMFDIQKNDPEMAKLTELPCMVKDVHGDNIIFVQNFAEMFGHLYDPDKTYQFIVSRSVALLPDGQKYYDVCDEHGLPFRLKTSGNVFLQAHQKIDCKILKPYPNKLTLKLVSVRKPINNLSITPEKLIAQSGLSGAMASYLLRLFNTLPIFEEAREYLERNDAEWAIKALLAVTGIHEWKGLKYKNIARVLDAYMMLALYVLEDSKFLLQFSDSERENFQEWLAARIKWIETNRECISLFMENRCGEEIDNILRKIRNSYYIYDARKKMSLLISIFSMNPRILEERIDTILEIISESAKYWKVASFKKAFSEFLQFYIMSNRDTVNSSALIEDDHTNLLLHRMVRAICYLLLLTDGKGIDVPLYKSMLYHYLSFVRCKNVTGTTKIGVSMSDSLVEQAFCALLSAETRGREIEWDQDFGNTEVFAYQMSIKPRNQSTLTTRSYETDKIRFTVSTEGITIASATATGSERNVIPDNFLNWHNIQVYLDNPSKYPIATRSKMATWRKWWTKVENALFSDVKDAVTYKPRKLSPEVGAEVTVRVISQMPDNPFRFYCRIEDETYHGEGWIDSYIRGGSTAMFHYDPMFDLESFTHNGKPLLFRVKVNSVGSPYDNEQTYMFNAMNNIDAFIGENVFYGQESDCKLIYHDDRNHVFLGITEFGYGVFLPETTPDYEYGVGDTMHVRLTDCSRPQAMQAEVIGVASDAVDVKIAAEGLLLGYAEEKVYEVSADELAEEAMSVAEDQFDADYISQIICILDHKAVVESDNVRAFGYLSVAHILAGMIEDDHARRYIEQRQELLFLLEDYATNGKIDEQRIEALGGFNADIVDKFPVLKERMSEISVVNSLGKQENNSYLWDLTTRYNSGHILGKLARLALSYNMADGFDLADYRSSVISSIKTLLNISIAIPEIYSFGQEDQVREFKSSIVFPPDNGMKPDMQQQTFNIMKVICGMVNSYGGTLYLGVYDTGTAKGLDDDLQFFDNNKDKFDLYVRNRIRMALGDAVNASISIEHPHAGKHWIYAIKVAPSKYPVMLRLDQHYYLREGSSTYPIYDVDLLRQIMEERDFSRFRVDAAEMFDSTGEETSAGPETEDENREKSGGASPRSGSSDKEEASIATGRIRSNVTENWLDNYGVDTCAYLRFHSSNAWSILDDVPWEEGLLTLAIHNDEKNGYLVLVYEDGSVQKVSMDIILRKKPDARHKLFSGKQPIFISPMKRSDALLTIYSDSNGKRYLRLDNPDNIQEGKITEAGKRLVDVDFDHVCTCEVIPDIHHEDLRRMHNLKRSTLGFQVNNAYGMAELELLNRIGLPTSEILAD